MLQATEQHTLAFYLCLLLTVRYQQEVRTLSQYFVLLLNRKDETEACPAVLAVKNKINEISPATSEAQLTESMSDGRQDVTEAAVSGWRVITGPISWPAKYAYTYSLSVNYIKDKQQIQHKQSIKTSAFRHSADMASRPG